MSKFAKTNPFQRSIVLLILLSCLPLGFAKTKKIKQIKASANSAAYVAFSEKLDKEDRFRHALDRLTFGPRPGDFGRIQSLGLKKWLDAQLHPEKTPESPVLLADLAPFDSLRLSIRETYLRYPPPQLIAAVARGNGQLPEDPELRAIVVRLANRYLQKKNLPANGQLDQIDDDLELKIKVTDILTPDQIATLKTGKPDERRAVLETIPREKWNDFAWSLTRQQRQQLMAQAPVPLRRQLMLANNPQNVVTSDLSEAKILRAVYSEHQLQELLVDFWFNHFNVFIDKGADHYSITSYERDAIRPHVFGKFYDLLLATAKSPAMLFYLDNWQSVGPQPIPQRPMANNRAKRGLNENYGRELLELHTLGVDGGYTQKDVIEVARCFTGWTIAQPRKGGEFEYNDKVHDRGPKIVLGQVIPAGGGMGDGLKVLEILSRQPATAHFISLRLAQRFIADNPPPSLVNRMTETFLKTGGDLREVMETMIYSGEFWSPGSYRAKVKTPFEMVVSAVRATGADVTSALLLNNQIQHLGEPLYRKVEPNGYPIANADWVSSASLLDRMNFALALAHNRVPGVKVDLANWGIITQKDPMELARMILEQDPSDQTRSAIEKMLAAKDLQLELAQNAKAGTPQVPSLIAGLSLGSPEFQRR